MSPEASKSEDDHTDDKPVLESQTSDDTDRGWGERSDENDERLLEDRPPHWGRD